MVFLLMYILIFFESASKKFARPPKSGQNPIGEIAVAPLRDHPGTLRGQNGDFPKSF